MTSLQPLILLFWCPYFCEGDFRNVVCSRDSRFSFCPNDAVPNNVPIIAGKNASTSAKLSPANGSLSAINQFCSQYKADYANCANGPSPPPDFAKQFCVYYHDSCPGAAPLAVPPKVQDLPLSNASTPSPGGGSSWVNPFLARPGGIVNNPQLIGADTRGGTLPLSNVPGAGQQQPQPPPQPPPPKASAVAAEAPPSVSSAAIAPPQTNAANSIVGSTSNTQAGPVNVGSSSNVGLGGLANLISGGTGR